MLMKKQNDVSLQRGLPVEIVADSQSVTAISGEVVQFYYYNSGVLTIDAGQAAGTVVIAKLAQAGVLDDIGGKIGTHRNTSFAFGTGTILTTLKEFPWLTAEQGDDATGTGQAVAITTGFANGEYCIDHRLGIIYGKKATTGVSDTGSYKVAMTTSGGSTSVTSSENIAKVGGTAVPTAGATKSSSTPVVPVQPIDETGAIIKGGGASVTAQYISPTDFTAAYTSASTLTLTGLPYTLTSGVQIVYVKVRNTSTNLTTTYVAGSNNYGFGYSSGVVTIYLNGSAASVLTSNDMYEVGLNGQAKTYDPTTDTEKSIEQSPLSAKYVADSLLDTTNIAAATNYYPSSTGMSMDGYKNMSITGKIIEGDAVTDTIEIQATNDEDTTGASWITVYFYDVKNNIMNNIITTGGVAGTYTFAIDLSDFNFSYFRVKGVTADATNTWEIKMRRTAL